MNSHDVDAVIQSVRFQLYRENIYGALEIVEAARAAHPDPHHGHPGAAAAHRVDSTKGGDAPSQLIPPCGFHRSWPWSTEKHRATRVRDFVTDRLPPDGNALRHE